MGIPGIEIHRSYDEHGAIRVFAEGDDRYLAFGEDAQQSCINMRTPYRLAFEYTQAMMLSLLFSPKPKQITILGLGAGSLIHSLKEYDADLLLNVVELRPAVVQIAYDWFDLSRSPTINLHINDAEEYMSSTPENSDLIFTDIYNDEGMIDSQLEPNFIRHCYSNLNKDGILILNLWDQGRGTHPQALQILRDYFSDNCMSCQVDDGNLIIYAFKSGLPELNYRRLQPLANKLGKKLSIPINKLMQGLKAI
jgi:spermidine synthase